MNNLDYIFAANCGDLSREASSRRRKQTKPSLIISLCTISFAVGVYVGAVL